MRNLIFLFSALFVLVMLSSCEASELNDEINGSELQMVDPADDGTVDPGDDDEY